MKSNGSVNSMELTRRLYPPLEYDIEKSSYILGSIDISIYNRIFNICNLDIIFKEYIKGVTKYNNIDVIRNILDSKNINKSTVILKCSIEYGNLQFLNLIKKYLINGKIKNYLSNDICINYAVSNNKLVSLKWLFENRNILNLTFDDLTCSMICSEGNLKMLEWLCNRNVPLSSESCVNASIYGHLDILKWMNINKKSIFDLDTVFEHAKKQEIIDWANEVKERNKIYLINGRLILDQLPCIIC
jgi:hypothetical protein